MADYLLRAPDEDMARWKADAEKRGRSFAEHMRASLDLVHRCPTALLDQLLGPVNRPVEPARVVATADAVASTGDLTERANELAAREIAARVGRQVRPDPK